MTDYQRVYRDHPGEYDELVRAEDVDGNLIAALDELAPLAGLDAVEVGAGTGRITRLLLEAGVAHIVATEREPAMLALARAALGAHHPRARFEVADARDLPVESDSADFAIAGWVFGHFRSWMPDDWRSSIGEALDELDRVTRPSGAQIIVETLGTGSETPAAPNEALAEYYAWLEDERGFERRAIRTDYQFRTVEDAERITGFFFGPEFEARVRAENWQRVPECTGVWHRRNRG